MTPDRKNLLWRLVMGGAGLVFGYLLLVLLTPTFGTIVGYANEQPRLQVVQPEPPSPSVRVNYILSAAEEQFQRIPDAGPDYWPKPSLLVERETCWLVEFTRKEPIYRWLGFRQTYRPTDRAMYMSINKADNMLRYGRWCE